MSLALAVLALAVALLAGVLAYRRISGLERRLSALEGERRQEAETVRALSAGAVSHGEQVIRVQRELSRLKEQLTTLAARGGGAEVFEQAIRMARRGASREDIIQTCGLSQVEADLVLLLHREEE
ncbi:MAG: DUF2802 domain-containing protein [Ectothiorhodospiraceae bacterium]|nr:DUF2802 domain-containing protein [Ectothiorhodospiraceae bacterium]